jgi:hypothetical protein
VIDPSIAIPLASDTAIQHCALIDSELIQRLALHTTMPATGQLDKLISIHRDQRRVLFRMVIGSGHSAFALRAPPVHI